MSRIRNALSWYAFLRQIRKIGRRVKKTGILAKGCLWK
jgi:hypothetical protein